MECRICHQPIRFVRGLHPSHKRQATLAVHEADVSRIVTESKGQIVQPHPGAQRRLRQELENHHDRTQSTASTMPVSQADVSSGRVSDDPIPESLGATGHQRQVEELEQYNSVSPELTGGDVDADWQRAESSGEETPGGHAPTPDQDTVDEIARAVGIEFQDNEELHTHEEVLAERDRHRWEMNRNSTDGDSI